MGPLISQAAPLGGRLSSRTRRPSMTSRPLLFSRINITWMERRRRLAQLSDGPNPGEGCVVYPPNPGIATLWEGTEGSQNRDPVSEGQHPSPFLLVGFRLSCSSSVINFIPWFFVPEQTSLLQLSLCCSLLYVFWLFPPSGSPWVYLFMH